MRGDESEAGIDWFLIAAFAASSGAGGVSNAVLTNWYRDKGFGMGSVVGYIPTLFAGREVKLANTGKVFPLTPENRKKWKLWYCARRFTGRLRSSACGRWWGDLSPTVEERGQRALLSPITTGDERLLKTNEIPILANR